MILNLLISLFKPEKNGSLPVSQFFRKIFESKSIRGALGINLVVGGLLMGFLSTPSVALTKEEAIVVRPKENVLRTETTFKQPVSGYISQGFHWYHPAIDIVAPLGKPIYSIAKGKVKEVSYGRWGYGHKVVIEHENGFWSLYAHLDQINVESGQEVNKDTVVGTLGLTGWTTGPHLHLEIWQETHPVNPLTVLPDFNTQLSVNN